MRRMQNIRLKLYDKLFGSQNRITPEAVRWGYRLFLDREPESPLVVADKLERLVSTEDLRREFVSSGEFKQKNPGFHSVSLSGDEEQMPIEESSELEGLLSHIQKVWEYLGEVDPYWSVLVSERFKSSSIKDGRSEFYNSGRENVVTLFKTLERNGIDYAPFKTCLEYGCGVGRVTRWLAERVERVIAYDISRSHLQVAMHYLTEIGIQNVSLRHISKPHDIRDFPKVDIVYSVIVLQHNPPPIICLIIQEMMRALNSGGIAFFQLPTYRLGYKFSLHEYLAGEATQGGMEMHVLPQRKIFDIVTRENGTPIEVLEDRWTGLRYGERSNTFVIQKE